MIDKSQNLRDAANALLLALNGAPPLDEESAKCAAALDDAIDLYDSGDDT